MRKILLFGLLMMICSITLLGQVDIIVQDFESSTGYTTSVVEYTDGGGDYFIRSNGSNVNVSFTNTEGFFFGAQDTDGDGGPDEPKLNISNIDVSNYIDLMICIDIAEDDDGNSQDWDPNTELLFDYNLDGSGFQNGIHVQAIGGTNSEPAIDTNFDGVGDGAIITSTFTQYCVNIPNGSLLDLMATFSFLDAGDEDIAIDNIIVKGTLSAGTPGITLTDPTNNTSETGTSATFTAVLNSMPTTNVVLGISSADNSENTVSPTMLTFTSTDWDTPQPIIVTGVDDSDFDGDQTTTITVATIDAMSDDSYDGLSESKDVVNEDDEVIVTCLNDMTCEFEIVPVTLNSQMDNWECTGGSYSVSGFTGTAADDSELWLIYGELDMTSTSFASFNFDLAETFSGSEIEVLWTSSYTGCPDGAGNNWTSLGVYMDAVTGESIDISSLTGTAVYIGIKYIADGANGASSTFTLNNITTEADVCPTVNTPVVSSCALPTVVNFTSMAESVDEDIISIDVCVSIANPSMTEASMVEINMDDINSTATNGSDYTMITFPITLTFPATSAVDQCLTIQIIDDSNIEPGEDIILNLQNPTGGEMIELGANTQTTITINDDDTPTLTNNDVRINEVDADQAGTDAAEFIELFGTPNLSLNGLVVVLFNGGDDASYASYDLDGFNLDANGFLLIGTDGAVDFTVEIPINSSGIQNGAEGVALYLGNGSDFPNDTPITQTGLIDALVHKSGEGDDTGLNPLIESQPFLDDATEEFQVDENINGNVNTQSIQRGSWFVSTPTPRGMNVLPVKLTSFTAKSEKSSNILAWSTATEINNEFFAIERSADGSTFKPIGRVEGFGDSNRRIDYTFEDNTPLAGINYYRLRQVDFDGRFEYSDVVSVRNSTIKMSVYPTSTSDNITVEIMNEGEATVTLFSDMGQTVMTQILNQGTNKLDITSFPEGIYYIQIIKGTSTEVRKIIKI